MACDVADAHIKWTVIIATITSNTFVEEVLTAELETSVFLVALGPPLLLREAATETQNKGSNA